MKIIVTVCDLIHDGSGWSENVPLRKVTIDLPDEISERAASRRILKAARVQEMRKDNWGYSDYGPWRDGTLGVYAMIKAERL